MGDEALFLEHLERGSKMIQTPLGWTQLLKTIISTPYLTLNSQISLVSQREFKNVLNWSVGEEQKWQAAGYWVDRKNDPLIIEDGGWYIEAYGSEHVQDVRAAIPGLPQAPEEWIGELERHHPFAIDQIRLNGNSDSVIGSFRRTLQDLNVKVEGKVPSVLGTNRQGLRTVPTMDGKKALRLSYSILQDNSDTVKMMADALAEVIAMREVKKAGREALQPLIALSIKRALDVYLNDKTAMNTRGFKKIFDDTPPFKNNGQAVLAASMVKRGIKHAIQYDKSDSPFEYDVFGFGHSAFVDYAMDHLRKVISDDNLHTFRSNFAATWELADKKQRPLWASENSPLRLHMLAKRNNKIPLRDKEIAELAAEAVSSLGDIKQLMVLLNSDDGYRTASALEGELLKHSGALKNLRHQQPDRSLSDLVQQTSTFQTQEANIERNPSNHTTQQDIPRKRNAM